jgi:hypothetical protein
MTIPDNTLDKPSRAISQQPPASIIIIPSSDESCAKTHPELISGKV